MAEIITPYYPDLEKIVAESSDPTPKHLTPREYSYLLEDHGLRPGELSDVGILKLMELGLIKVWGEGFNLMYQIQACNLDLRIDNNFFTYRKHRNSMLPHDIDPAAMARKRLLDYDYVPDGQEFTFYQGKLVLAYTREEIALSNAVVARFDGKSKQARRGLSTHQTASIIHPGFVGPIMMELSNTNELDLPFCVPDQIGSLTFSLLSSPSSRPRNLGSSHMWTHMQRGPFGYWDPSWDNIRAKALLQAGKNGFSEDNKLNPILT